MSAPRPDLDAMPVVSSIVGFDHGSGMRLERLIFNHRRGVICAIAAATAILSFFALSKTVMNADFERMIPTHHPYVRNYLDNKGELRGLGNSLHVVVENPHGDIYDPVYLESLRQISEDLFLALDTVKGHNRRIFGKLQVQTRTEAIARARVLGLV